MIPAFVPFYHFFLLLCEIPCCVEFFRLIFWLRKKYFSLDLKTDFFLFFQSYGGFYSATTLAMAGDVIKTAVAVAPVTDWRYYGKICSLDK